MVVLVDQPAEDVAGSDIAQDPSRRPARPSGSGLAGLPTLNRGGR